MAWCRQAIPPANVDPDLCYHMASLGHNELTARKIKIWFNSLPFWYQNQNVPRKQDYSMAADALTPCVHHVFETAFFDQLHIQQHWYDRLLKSVLDEEQYISQTCHNQFLTLWSCVYSVNSSDILKHDNDIVSLNVHPCCTGTSEKEQIIPFTHCGLVTPYGNLDPGQDWLR